MAPKESLWGKERVRENGSPGGFFFSCARGTTSPYHITGTTLTFPTTHSYCTVYSSVESYVTDCYARNALYHSAHVQHQGLASSNAERAEYIVPVTLAV